MSKKLLIIMLLSLFSQSAFFMQRVENNFENVTATICLCSAAYCVMECLRGLRGEGTIYVEDKTECRVFKDNDYIKRSELFKKEEDLRLKKVKEIV